MTVSKERKAELTAQFGNSPVRLLSYIKKNDIVEYRELIKALGIRDNIQ